MTEHPFIARYEAASKLVTNHERVLRDLCRADGPPTSQPELARLPGQEREVNIFMREATRRLREATQPGQRTRQPTRAGRFDVGRRRRIPGGAAAGVRGGSKACAGSRGAQG